jgi:hypothetical protein
MKTAWSLASIVIAWVLWYEADSNAILGRRAFIVDTFATKDACDARIARARAKEHAEGIPDARSAALRYICLPYGTLPPGAKMN